MLTASVFVVATNTKCTSGVELLVDGKQWQSTPLYKTLGSSGNFVRCRQCNSSSRGNPNWFTSSNQKILLCNDKVLPTICIKHVSKSEGRHLHFLSFMESEVGTYTCKGDDKTVSIMIDVVFLPVVLTHPASQVIRKGMNVTLSCSGTGGGSVAYYWETSTITGKWMKIVKSNDSKLVVRNLEQSQQYRCVVSNNSGSARSNVAIITVLGKYKWLDS